MNNRGFLMMTPDDLILYSLIKLAIFMITPMGTTILKLIEEELKDGKFWMNFEDLTNDEHHHPITHRDSITCAMMSFILMHHLLVKDLERWLSVKVGEYVGEEEAAWVAPSVQIQKLVYQRIGRRDQ
ncbi:hypothetical protein KP509_07G083800 [Ceratopteris richardii]|uniref:Uncharacterized protein n=1 Tax=Ceratopteris richardii TaxID=49495 RepID=A0A8T2UCR7_CERRI|nr:hypothetical protein KP509_07G083800 [Ceratopteris richardii]